MFHIARFLKVSYQRALAFAFLLGLTTLVWRYSVWDYSEAAQMFFLVAAVYGVLEGTSRHWVFASASMLILILLKVIHVVYVPVFLFYLFMKKKDMLDSRGLFHFLGWVSFAVTLLLVLNYVRFHDPFKWGYSVYEMRFPVKNIPKGLFTILFSFKKGLFVYAPVLILGVAGFPAFYQKHRRECLLFLGLIFVNAILMSAYWGYMEPWSLGPRYLVPFIPFYLFPVCYFISENKNGRRFLFPLIILISFSIQTLAVLQSDQEYHHIKLNMVDKSLRKKMPPDIAGLWILLKHKMLKKNQIYKLSEFGIPLEGSIETTQYRTHHGFNLWYCHLARYYGQPVLRYVPVVFAPWLILSVLSLLKAVRSADLQEEISD